jgi:hypothetical protein
MANTALEPTANSGSAADAVGGRLTASVIGLNHDYSRHILRLPDTIDPREPKGVGPGVRRDR